MDGFIGNLDPHNYAADQSWRVGYNIYETPLDFDVDLKPVPQLATGMEVSDDGQTLTFDIREGVMFHPPVGTEMKAADVAYSMNRVLDDERSARAGYAGPFADITATDEYTVEGELETPYSPIGARIGLLYQVIPENSDENYDLEQQPIGTGPFRFDELQEDSYVQLAAFEEYWQTDENGTQLPYLDSVRMQSVPEVSSRVTNIKSNAIQNFAPVPGSQIEDLKNSENVDVVTNPGTRFSYLCMNTREEPWDDVKLRQGVSWAIDRTAVVQGAYFGHAEAIQHPVNPSTEYANRIDVENPYHQDKEKARSLIEESSYDGHEAVITVPRAHSQEKAAAEIIQQQLEEVGIENKLNLVDNSTWFEVGVVAPFDIELAVGGWGGLMDPQFSFNQFETGHNLNNSGIADSEIDQLLEEGTQKFGIDERAPVYEQLANRLNELAPYVFLTWTTLSVANRKEVEGYKAYPFSAGSQQFRTVWLNNE